MVRPDLQARGLGRILVTAAETNAGRWWGAPRMQMRVVEPRQELIAWYDRQGYARTGETIPFRPANPGSRRRGTTSGSSC